jgi:hypothetical protein
MEDLLRSITDPVMKELREQFKEHGAADLQIGIIDNEGIHFFEPIRCEEQKFFTLRIANAAISSGAAQGVITCAESWVRDMPALDDTKSAKQYLAENDVLPPSRDPERREALVVSCTWCTGISILRMIYIKRDKNGKPTLDDNEIVNCSSDIAGNLSDFDRRPDPNLN